MIVAAFSSGSRATRSLRGSAASAVLAMRTPTERARKSRRLMGVSLDREVNGIFRRWVRLACVVLQLGAAVNLRQRRGVERLGRAFEHDPSVRQADDPISEAARQSWLVQDDDRGDTVGLADIVNQREHVGR